MTIPHHLKRRLMLWFLGQTVPEAPVLLPFVRVGMLGLTAAIAGGLLFTLGIVGLLAALYFFLLGEGIAPGPSLLIVAGVSFILAFAVFFVAQQVFRRRLKVLHNDWQGPRLPEIEETLLELPRVLILSFLEGFLGKRYSESENLRNKMSR